MADSALTSRELMARANISRATLNNYIGLGILPKPALPRAKAPAGRRRASAAFQQPRWPPWKRSSD